MPRPTFSDIESFSREKFLNTLAESYVLQDAILNTTELLVISTDAAGIISSFNVAAANLLGYTLKEVIGRATPAIIHDPDEIAKRAKELTEELKQPVMGFEAFAAKARITRKPDRREWTYIRKNGERFPVMLSVSAIWNDQDELTGYVGIATDITEQKKINDRVLNSESHLHALLSSIDDIAFEITRDLVYKNIWTKNESLLFIEREKYTGKSIYEILSGPLLNLRPLFTNAIQKVFNTQQPEYIEYHIHEIDQWRSGKISYINEDSILLLVRNITKQKLAEEELRKVSEENDRVFNYSIALNAVAGFDGFFKKLNPEWTNVLGWTLEELTTKPFIDFVHPEDIERTKMAALQLAEGKNLTTFENRYRCKDGSYRWIIWCCSSDLGRQLIYASANDFTDRKKFEEQLLVSKANLEGAAEELQEQNQQLNEFAHIISHNLRSPVGNIAALISLLNEKSTIDEYRDIFDKLKTTSGNLQTTLNDLMETLRIKKEVMSDQLPLSFEETFAKTTQDLVGEIIQSAGKVTANFSVAPEIVYSKTYLESIFLNLLSNALKYRSPKRQPKIHFETKLHEGKIQLIVSDNGLGIDLEKNGKKLFGLRKTFHVHKEARGVGLFLTKTQVEAMGGKIWAASAEDQGATFYIQF